MPKTIVGYAVDKELTAAVDRVLTSHPRLLPIKDNVVIAVCFLIREDEQGESLPSKNNKYVVIKKVAPAFQVFMKPKAHFILVVDRHWWNEKGWRQRDGAVVRMLTRIWFEPMDNAEVKVGLNGWDIEETYDSLKISGSHSEETRKLIDIALVLKAAQGGIAKREAEDRAAASNGAEENKKPAVIKNKRAEDTSAKEPEEPEEPEERTRPPRKIPADPEPVATDSEIESDD